MVFSSFDENTVALWRRGTTESPIRTPVTMSVTPDETVVDAGATTTVHVELTTLAGLSPEVTLHRTRRGRTASLGALALTEVGEGRYVGEKTLQLPAFTRVEATYAGTLLSPTYGDATAAASADVAVRSTLSRVRVRTLTKKAAVVWTARLSPTGRRGVVLQQEVCAPRGEACRWRARSRGRSRPDGRIEIAARLPRGTSRWRLRVPADEIGTAVAGPVRAVRRR